MGSGSRQMKQAVLQWNKKLASKKHVRGSGSIKSDIMQRKATRRSQAGPEEIWEAPLPERIKKTSLSEWSKWELLAIIGSVFLLLYIMLCYENFHFHVAHMYAHLGYPSAQHIVGQRYLKASMTKKVGNHIDCDFALLLGAGVEKNEEKAMQWFRQAAEQGHPHSSFNLAVGKLKNMTTMLEEGDIEKFLNVAAGHGLQEAQNLLDNIRNRPQP